MYSAGMFGSIETNNQENVSGLLSIKSKSPYEATLYTPLIINDTDRTRASTFSTISVIDTTKSYIL